MPVTLSIKNVPEELAEKLRQRAEKNHRSLQGELMAILEEAVRERITFEEPARERITIEELARRVKARGVSSPSESARIIREARDARGRR